MLLLAHHGQKHGCAERTRTVEWERSATVLKIPGAHVVVPNANVDCGVDRHNLVDFIVCGSFYCHTLSRAVYIRSFELLLEVYR